MNLSLASTLPGARPHTLRCRPVWVSPLGWLALQAAALWPHGRWMWQRIHDGSDDPLGLAALAMLAVAIARLAPRLRALPRLPWLAASVALTLAATAAHLFVPPLPAAMLAAIALSTALIAWLPEHTPRLPFAGLMLLALPLIASLQFYAGFPLRALTAELSAWGLQALGFEAARSGASMVVDGRLVIVDAPCSGVQLAWLGYFAACSVAAFVALPDGAFLRRLPLVGVLVLTGNVLRNTALVALEARPEGLAPAWHEAIGLAALVVTSVLIVIWMQRKARHATPL